MRQVVIREVDPQPWRQIQIRGLSEPNDVDVLAAPSDPLSLASAFAAVLDRVRADNLNVRLTDGTEVTAGYESSNSLLGRSLRLGRDVQGLILWLSPNLRMQFRGREDDALQAAAFESVQIPTVTTSVVKHLTALLKDRQFQPYDVPIQPVASRYLASRDVIDLRHLQKMWREAAWTRVLDIDSGQTYLVGHDGVRLLVVSLAELPIAGPQIMECDQISPETIREFLDRRASWWQPRRSAS